MSEREIPCSDIRTGERFRKDMGDLDVLARSIQQVGLIHAIVVSPDLTLIVGERRLRAVRDILRRPMIRAEVLDLDRFQAERDENEIRKQFTPSERAQIARAFRERVGNRQGQRTDLGEATEELVGKRPQVEDGEKTRQAAARAGGFTSEKQLRRAETVLESGVPSLIEAMDKEAISISGAAQLAKLPTAVQEAAVQKIGQGAMPPAATAESNDKAKTRKLPAPRGLKELRSVWKKASPEARAAFLNEIRKDSA